MPAGRRAQNHTQTLTHKQDKIRMNSPRHPVMQAAEPFSDPAGTHCAGATDGANVIVMMMPPCTTELYGQRTGHYGWETSSLP